MRIILHRPWTATVACIAIAIALLCWFHLSTSRPDEKAVAASEDEVYEAVVRDMVAPIPGQTNMRQLVFDDTVLTDLAAGVDMKSCEERVRERLRLQASTPPFNSLVDKIYRVVTLHWNDRSVRADTIQDFLEKSCTVGRLSETFRTDLPRTFIAVGSAHFEGWPVEKNGAPSFEQLFPGATGIISFSHVGFDSTLHEAIVSTAFVCGGLCGNGRRYILRKKWGKWEVADKRIVWVS